jgi:cell shape-determining protein MreC
MITTLGCQSLNDTLYLDAERLTAQLGSNHGVTPNMLAITSGKHSPWTVLRVVSVSSNSSILEPLDKARELSELDGKVVEFMELN